MPEWLLTILIGGVGAVLTILIKYAWDNSVLKRHNKVVAHDQLLEKQKIQQEIQQPLENIYNKLDIIDQKLSLTNESQMLLLRDRMSAIVTDCKKLGYADEANFITWSEMHNSYTILGGNHNQEMINAWTSEMQALNQKYINQIKKGE